MSTRSKSVKSGFTLVELSFAIAFISVLLIIITLITNEIVTIYRKGYSIKTINQVGRDIIDDFQDAITQSPPTLISSFCARTYADDPDNLARCNSDGGFASVYQQFYAQISVANSEDSPNYLPTGGVFCSGKYSYIWNTGYLFNSDNYTGAPASITVSYSLADASGSGATGSITGFRLIKVEDTSRSVCAASIPLSSPSGKYPQSNDRLKHPTTAIVIPEPLASAPEELLKDSDAALALYDFVLFKPARVASTNRLLFSGSFILGTITGGVDIMTSSNYCKAPANFSADFSYCAINKFNFTIQASGNK